MSVQFYLNFISQLGMGRRSLPPETYQVILKQYGELRPEDQLIIISLALQCHEDYPDFAERALGSMRQARSKTKGPPIDKEEKNKKWLTLFIIFTLLAILMVLVILLSVDSDSIGTKIEEWVKVFKVIIG